MATFHTQDSILRGKAGVETGSTCVIRQAGVDLAQESKQGSDELIGVPGVNLALKHAFMRVPWQCSSTTVQPCFCFWYR